MSRAMLNSCVIVIEGKKRLEMDVGYVDYGNTERLPLSRVRPLPEKFHKLPFQAFLCSLSQVGHVMQDTKHSTDLFSEVKHLNFIQHFLDI